MRVVFMTQEETKIIESAYVQTPYIYIRKTKADLLILSDQPGRYNVVEHKMATVSGVGCQLLQLIKKHENYSTFESISRNSDNRDDR